MRCFIAFSIIMTSLLASGCNTVGGFGQDVSNAGQAINKAAR